MNQLDQFRDRLAYTIRHNATGVKKVLIAAGFNRVSTPYEIEVSAMRYLATGGENAVLEVLGEHPDYKAITEVFQAIQPEKEDPQVQETTAIVPQNKQALQQHNCPFSLSKQADYIGLLMFLACVFLVLKIFKD
jgi:hypothetical protein